MKTFNSAFLFLILFGFISFPSAANKPISPRIQAKRFLDAGMKKFAPCYADTPTLMADCKKGCTPRCVNELKVQMQDKANAECNKICTDHCTKVVAQADKSNCNLIGALNDFNQAYQLDPANPTILINRAYVLIGIAKEKGVAGSNKDAAIKDLTMAKLDTQKAKQMFVKIKDQNAINLADSTLQTINQNLEFLKK